MKTRLQNFLFFIVVLTIPVSIWGYTAATTPTEKVIERNTYALIGDVKCQIPLTDTEIGAFTAAHCLKEKLEAGQKRFEGVNAKGEHKTFIVKTWDYTYRGRDYVHLTDGDGRGLPIYTGQLHQGMPIQIYSPKCGLTKGTIKILPREDIDPLRFYIDIGQCGESGSLVLTMNGEAMGIFVARTGPPGNTSPGVVLRLQEIKKVL